MEEMMMINNTTSPENPRKSASTWKLYDNPFYIPQQHQKLEKQDSFSKPLMQSELESCKAQILDLKSKLEYERKEHKKLESLNKKLARELSLERKNREEYESLCEKLTGEISANETMIDVLKKEIEEERKMIRVAEVFREERVQMKFSEAKTFLEEKLTEFKEMPITKNQENKSPDRNVGRTTTPFEGRVDSSSGEGRRVSLTEKSTMSNESSGSVQSKGTKTRITPDSARGILNAHSVIDNPHIRRGIKGFVEFPKVIRAMGSKSQRHSGNRLECQKAQIRLILKQKSPPKANNIIIAS